MIVETDNASGESGHWAPQESSQVSGMATGFGNPMRDNPVGVRFNDGDAVSEIRNSRSVITTRGGVLRMRWMSPREYARLQGADDFPLVGTTNQQLFGFGDAVCVPVIKWIDDRVLTPIAASLEPVRR